MVDMIERWTADQRVARSSLNAGGVTMLCPWARVFIRCSLLVQPDMTEIVDWDVKNQTKSMINGLK